MKNSVSSRSEELWNHRACLNSCWTMNLNAAKPPKMAKKPETFMKKWAGSVYHNENLPKRS